MKTLSLKEAADTVIRIRAEDFGDDAIVYYGHSAFGTYLAYLELKRGDKEVRSRFRRRNRVMAHRRKLSFNTGLAADDIATMVTVFGFKDAWKMIAATVDEGSK